MPDPGAPVMKHDETMPSAYELWKQAGGGTSEYSSDEYQRLMREAGLLVPLKPGEKPQGQPCGWPRGRAGYQCSVGGDACPGHVSKWLMCTPETENGGPSDHAGPVN